MIIEEFTRRDRLNVRTGAALGLSVVVFFGALIGNAQGLTGKWAAAGRTLENGEQDKAIVELQQNGNDLTGTIQSLGWSTAIRGTVNGNHFEIFGTDWNDKKPFLVGNLVNGEIQGTQWGNNCAPG